MSCPYRIYFIWIQNHHSLSQFCTVPQSMENWGRARQMQTSDLWQINQTSASLSRMSLWYQHMEVVRYLLLSLFFRIQNIVVQEKPNLRPLVIVDANLLLLTLTPQKESGDIQVMYPQTTAWNQWSSQISWVRIASRSFLSLYYFAWV